MKKTAMWLAALCVCALLVSVAVVQAAPQANANVNGMWTITMAPMQGGGGGGGGNRGGGGGGGTPPAPPTVTFKQDGVKLSGSQSGRGGDISIDGSVSGNTVTWTVKRPGRGEGAPDVITVYKATVDGDSMKGTATTGDRPARDFTAAKMKM
ncbi:MAG: hypothetical protein ACRD5L_15805 [Bryobacteraceae bacterium]